MLTMTTAIVIAVVAKRINTKNISLDMNDLNIDGTNFVKPY